MDEYKLYLSNEISTLAEKYIVMKKDLRTMHVGVQNRSVYETEFCFADAPSRQQFFDDVTNFISKSGLSEYTNFDYLKKEDNQQLSSHKTLQELQKMAMGRKSESTLLNEVTHMLSCSDGNNYLNTTSSKLASALIRAQKGIGSITGGDFDCPRPGEFLVEPFVLEDFEEPPAWINDRQLVHLIKLDNTKLFIPQLSKYSCPKTFQCVIGMKLLCCCDSSMQCCGGLRVGSCEQQIASFLRNIETVLDADFPNAIAIIEGDNPIEGFYWQHEIDQFNNESLKFRAEIIRNSFDQFAGIIIKKNI